MEVLISSLIHDRSRQQVETEVQRNGELVGGTSLLSSWIDLRSPFQFSSVLAGMLGSTIPVSIIGVRYAMSIEPFWKPEQYSASLSCPPLSSQLVKRTTSPNCGDAVWKHDLRHRRFCDICSQRNLVSRL